MGTTQHLADPVFKMSALHELPKGAPVLSVLELYFKLYPVGLERNRIKGWVIFSQPKEEQPRNFSVNTKKNLLRPKEEVFFSTLPAKC